MLDYSQNLKIQPFIKNESGSLIGTINLDGIIKDFEINYIKIEEYMLVYISKELKKC
jgi:hypothetical protein